MEKEKPISEDTIAALITVLDYQRQLIDQLTSENAELKNQLQSKSSVPKTPKVQDINDIKTSSLNSFVQRIKDLEKQLEKKENELLKLSQVSSNQLTNEKKPDKFLGFFNKAKKDSNKPLKTNCEPQTPKDANVLNKESKKLQQTMSEFETFDYSQFVSIIDSNKKVSSSKRTLTPILPEKAK